MCFSVSDNHNKKTFFQISQVKDAWLEGCWKPLGLDYWIMDSGTCEPAWVSLSQRGRGDNGCPENFSHFIVLVYSCFLRKSLGKTVSRVLEILSLFPLKHCTN